MSTITSISRNTKLENMTPAKTDKKLPPTMDMKIESRLNIKDLESLQEAFMAEGDGYDNRLSLNKDQFCEALSLILNKGNKNEYADLFDKIDATREGHVDWDKFASHMLLEFYEKDDRVKSTQVPQWKDLKVLQSPHKDVIQKLSFLKISNRYMTISKEGCVAMWGQDLKLQRTLKTGTDTCKQRDLWVTNFVLLQNINKIALAFTSKEIAFYDLSTKLEFNCQYKVQGLDYTPLSMDYWSNPDNVNEAIIVWGDTGGCVNALNFTSVNIALFERPPAPAGEKQEPCLNVRLEDILKKKYKNAKYTKHQGHSEWVRQVRYSPHLECFISCATTWKNSMVIGWIEKQAVSKNMKLSTFEISQGVNAFDHHPQLNLIATAGVNHHVCLWNPYVVSKPNGVLRGHMAAVVQVQFNKTRAQLISFSKDKVLRIWDVQLQVCIQRLAGMFPKGPEVFSSLYYDEQRMRLFITFNYQLTMLEMKPEIKDRVLTHDKPIIAAIFNSTYNQVVTACQNGTLTMWMIDTGQKVKNFTNIHGNAELTTLAQDQTETRIYTGSTDGTVKIWDYNGHCYHTLDCGGGQPADVGHILVLKRTVLVAGWAKYITIFRNQSFKDFHVQPSDWKGGQEHSDDVLALAFFGSSTLASGSYDGEIVIWNTNSEQASRRMTQRCRKTLKKEKSFLSRETTRATEGGFNSHTFNDDRPRTRPRSRATSRVSEGSHDEQNEFGFAISCLLFLEARKAHSASGGGNLVSCGGNGWVRFWNTANCHLVAEFPAHTQVGSIIMETDSENHWLVTGDVDGLIKVWNISEYAIREIDEVITTLPPLKASWSAHIDMVNSLKICVRNDRILILSTSSDCSVALNDIYGNPIGVFGQEMHWKIEPYVAKEEEEESEQDEEDLVHVDEGEEEDSDWEPDTGPTENPAQYRMNTWDNTCLGKDYQELRVKKRQRQQPAVIPDLPYLHWERTGQAPAGPYSALDTPELTNVKSLKRPDFMQNPDRYFRERPDNNQEEQPQALAERLKAAFDEKTLFPKYILDYESKVKAAHQEALKDLKNKSKFPATTKGNTTTVPPRQDGLRQEKIATKPLVKPTKLKPMSVRSSSSGGD